MTSERKPRTDLPGYFKGISRRLELQVELMTPVIVHNGEMGDNDHRWFADLLRQHLPQKFGVDTGFVVNFNSDQGSADFFAAGEQPRTQVPFISPQMDILLLDVLHNAPFCVEKTFKVCPVEMVIGAIEVTRDLDASRLRTECAKLSRVKELGAEKRYRGGVTSSIPWRPFGFVVGLASSLSEDTMKDVVGDIDTTLRPDGIFLLDKAFYSFGTGSQYFTFTEDRLFHFIARVRRSLDYHPVYGADLLVLCHTCNLG